MKDWYETLGWLMYLFGVAAAAAFWFYLDGFPEGRVPYIAIGLPAIPFVALGKYFFERDRKAAKR